MTYTGHCIDDLIGLVERLGKFDGVPEVKVFSQETHELVREGAAEATVTDAGSEAKGDGPMDFSSNTAPRMRQLKTAATLVCDVNMEFSEQPMLNSGHRQGVRGGAGSSSPSAFTDTEYERHLFRTRNDPEPEED